MSQPSFINEMILRFAALIGKNVLPLREREREREHGIKVKERFPGIRL